MWVFTSLRVSSGISSGSPTSKQLHDGLLQRKVRSQPFADILAGDWRRIGNPVRLYGHFGVCYRGTTASSQSTAIYICLSLALPPSRRLQPLF